MSAEEIVTAAESRYQQAERSPQYYEDRITHARKYYQYLDLDVIALGGGMSNVVQIYGTDPKIWSQREFSGKIINHLFSPKFGETGSLKSAAWLWDDVITL